MPHKQYKAEKALLQGHEDRMADIRAMRPTTAPHGFAMNPEFEGQPEIGSNQLTDSMREALVLAFWMTLVGLICMVALAVMLRVVG